LGEVLSSFR